MENGDAGIVSKYVNKLVSKDTCIKYPSNAKTFPIQEGGISCNIASE